MWGTSSPGDKLTGDFGNEPDATSISDRGLYRLLAGNLSPGVFRLLQHNLHFGDIARSQIQVRFRCKSGHTAGITAMTGFGPRADIGWIENPAAQQSLPY
jgi:hypothetical protein